MQSIWSSSTTDKARAPYPSLSGDIKTDVLVIGGGMAGVLIAHRLKQSGLACVIAEENERLLFEHKSRHASYEYAIAEDQDTPWR